MAGHVISGAILLPCTMHQVWCTCLLPHGQDYTILTITRGAKAGNVECSLTRISVQEGGVGLMEIGKEFMRNICRTQSYTSFLWHA